MLWIQRRGAPHLFRTGQLPPLRGTSVQLDENNAQLDERDPFTLRTADRVGSILEHVPEGARIATRYTYYM